MFNNLARILNIDTTANISKFLSQYSGIRNMNMFMTGNEVINFPNAIMNSSKWNVKNMALALNKVYCTNVGVEYGHLENFEQYKWLENRIENILGPNNWSSVDNDTKHLDIMEKLLRTHAVSQLFHQKYPKSKVFGLEGSETVINGLFSVLETLSVYGADAVNIGMAHRGRMEILHNVLNKSLEVLCTKFSEAEPYVMHDVKFHAGARGWIEVFPDDNSKRRLKISLSANPSHLELINPIVLGKTKSMQFFVGDKKKSRIVPVLIHGDASFAGQGIVAEALELSQLPDYDVGGCIHIIVNNQIGFTTEAKGGRSSLHCTNMAKVIQAPIFHVNGDDVEAVVSVCQLASEYRQLFHRDVVIDIVGYRRFGHSSLEDPFTTNPMLYHKIKTHPNVATLYSNELVRKGIISAEYVDKKMKDIMNEYEEQYQRSKSHVGNPAEWLAANWQVI